MMRPADLQQGRGAPMRQRPKYRASIAASSATAETLALDLPPFIYRPGLSFAKEAHGNGGAKRRLAQGRLHPCASISGQHATGETL
jgi:hypothetical protein